MKSLHEITVRGARRRITHTAHTRLKDSNIPPVPVPEGQLLKCKHKQEDIKSSAVLIPSPVSAEPSRPWHEVPGMQTHRGPNMRGGAGWRKEVSRSCENIYGNDYVNIYAAMRIIIQLYAKCCRCGAQPGLNLIGVKTLEVSMKWWAER